MSVPSIDVNDVQQQIASSVRRFSSERSVDLESPLFDIPKKMALANYGGAVMLPRVCELVEERITPEELGSRMRTLGYRLPVGLGALAWCFPLGRLQRQLDQGWPDSSVDESLDDEARRLYAFFARASSTYREDGKLLPGEDGAAATMQILDADVIESVAVAAGERGAPDDVPGVRRVFGQLATYSFMLHAEQRDGIFNHGPYELDDGTTLLVKEYTDLQNPYLPWVDESRWLPVSRVVVPLVVRDTKATFDQFGTLYSDPEDVMENVVAFDILAGDALEQIDESELVAIGDATKTIQRAFFREMMGFDERLKIFVGPITYSNAFSSLLEGAGYTEDEVREHLVKGWNDVADQYVDRFLAGESSPVWEYIGSGRDPLFPEVQ